MNARARLMRARAGVRAAQRREARAEERALAAAESRLGNGGRRKPRDVMKLQPSLATLHPDDPRNYCHCGIEKKPVAECPSGACYDRFPARTPGRPWESPRKRGWG